MVDRALFQAVYDALDPARLVRTEDLVAAAEALDALERGGLSGHALVALRTQRAALAEEIASPGKLSVPTIEDWRSAWALAEHLCALEAAVWQARIRAIYTPAFGELDRAWWQLRLREEGRDFAPTPEQTMLGGLASETPVCRACQVAVDACVCPAASLRDLVQALDPRRPAEDAPEPVSVDATPEGQVDLRPLFTITATWAKDGIWGWHADVRHRDQPGVFATYRDADRDVALRSAQAQALDLLADQAEAGTLPPEVAALFALPPAEADHA
jgi:hypothetical protein